MTDMRKLSSDELEARRLAAGQDLATMSQSSVAKRYGISRTTVSRWARQLDDGGPDALKKRKHTGRPSRLNAQQLAQIEMFCGKKTTGAALQAIVAQKFGVNYAKDHMYRLRARVRKATL